MQSVRNIKMIKKQYGVTLLELMAGLTVMAVVVAGALSLYQSAMASQRTTQLAQDLAAIRAAAKQIWQGQGNYGANGTSLNNVLVFSKRVPTTIRVDTNTNPPTLTHVANGTISLTSAVSAFDVTLTNIDEELCVPMLTGAHGWQSVTVGSGSAITVFPVNPPTAVNVCSAGTTVVFRGN
ncbi:MAG: prepilin-type N-terminal cleavage/methylation domain-containing protein [Hydrogenophaga sp.]|uniref:type IV pilin protein n=1 Tax=Hydrogenophaga sp. TaxID=1904254 RepID=UPI002607BF7B|nr:type 4 pilus major pilin [Hydrogenophaga sp.]MCV0438989.1 prepilin-type N-terminal cleavage/methylation domain-containing protein [Hydrogenophaga sp.]